jgi:hypothetical protein
MLNALRLLQRTGLRVRVKDKERRKQKQSVRIWTMKSI